MMEIKIYIKDTKAICSIEYPLSIKKPKRAVPKAVEKTISDVERALIDPIYFTP